MRRFGLYGIVILVICCGIAAAKKFPLTAATIVPGARGEVEIGHDRNKNTEVKMKVEHLAKPDSLTPPKTTYIVWLQEKGADAENSGQLKINNKEQGSFRTTTPRKSFDVFVTAEQDGSAKAPSGPEVLRTSVQP